MQRRRPPATVAPPENAPQPGGPHADATANSAGPRLFDRIGTVRSLDTARSTVPRTAAPSGEGLEDPGAGRLRLLLLPVVLPAFVLGRHPRPVSALQPGRAQPLSRGRHRGTGL